MFEKFKIIAQDNSLDKEKFDIEFEKLIIESRHIDKDTLESRINEKEKRYGHRAALIQFRRTCSGCNKIPESMKPTDCPICGKL